MRTVPTRHRRQPKGQPTGGQFAPSVKPEAQLELAETAAPLEVVDGQPGRRHRNPNGTPGGFVASTATVSETSTVGELAQVRDHAVVVDSNVLDVATVSGNAVIYHSTVGGEAMVTGAATVRARSLVAGSAVVDRDGIVTDRSTVTGDAVVTNDGFVGGAQFIDTGWIDDSTTAPVVESPDANTLPSSWLDEDQARPVDLSDGPAVNWRQAADLGGSPERP